MNTPTADKKLLYIAGAKPSYPRNTMALKMLREKFTLYEITSTAGSYFLRFPQVALKFIFSRKNVDAIYVGFMGHPLVVLARLFSRQPIIFDVFISLYDSICLERRVVSPDSLLGKIIFLCDKVACQLSDVVIVDTATHAAWFTKTFNLPPKKIKVFYICADETLFRPQPSAREARYMDKFVVEFHGGFIPLQGVEFIIRAAEKLKDQSEIFFRFLGNGRDLPMAKKLAQELKLANIEFIDDFVPLEKVPKFINESDVALGIFGLPEKTTRVVPNKAYEALACHKPLVTADTVAAREIFRDRENVLFCKAGDPADLAAKILALHNDPALRVALTKRGAETFAKVCNYGERRDYLTKIVSETIK